MKDYIIKLCNNSKIESIVLNIYLPIEVQRLRVSINKEVEVSIKLDAVNNM